MNADLFVRLFAAFGLLAASAAAAPLVARKRRAAGVLNLALVSAAAALLLSVSAEALFGHAGHAVRTVSLGPVAVPFLVDGFSAVFLAVIAFMAVMSALYSVRYMDHYPEYGLGGYNLCYPLFVLGMAALVTVDDLALGFTLAWQLMTVASFVLVRFERRKAENRRGAAKYLVLMELAWLLIVAATFFVDGYRFGAPLAEIAAGLRSTAGLPLFAVLALFLAGFGMKAGVWPLGRLWLPDAHSVAPSPVSALLSGVMLKTGVYGLMRTFLFMVPAGAGAFDGRAWGLAVAAIGSVTLLVGTVQSMKQSDAKRLLAYSSIGQIGYIVLATGAVLYLGTTGEPALRLLALAAAAGALFHVLNHAIFKGLLFLTSGSILYATGTKDLNKLGGLIRLMPASAAVAGVAALSISGMPPFSGFSSKWTIIASTVLVGGSFPAHRGTVALVLFGIVALFTSAVTLACYVKFFGMAFTSSGAEHHAAKPIREVPGSMLAPKIALTAVALVQGLFPALSIGLVLTALGRSEGFLLARGPAAPPGAALAASPLGVGLPDFGAAAAPLVVLFLVGAGLAFGAMVRRAGGAKRVEAPTWLCGYQDLNEANRYADRGMFAALRGLFKFAGGKSGK